VRTERRQGVPGGGAITINAGRDSGSIACNSSRSAESSPITSNSTRSGGSANQFRGAQGHGGRLDQLQVRLEAEQGGQLLPGRDVGEEQGAKLPGTA